MDYAEEQAMEVDALRAILMDEFEDLQGPRPAGWPEDVACYRVLITPTTEGGEAAASDEKQLDLVFAYPPTYPDAAPLLKPRSVRGLSGAELAEVSAACDAAVEANGGMPMMYAVISAAQDWLREVVGRGVGAGADGGGGGAEADDEAAAAAAKAAAAEAEEQRLAAARALGTPVTPASFAAWRARFEAEMAAARAEKGGGGAGTATATGAGTAAASRSGTGAGAGPTGREYFQALDAGAAAAEGGDGDGGGEEFPEEEEEDEEEEEEVELSSGDDDDDDLEALEQALAGAAVE